MLTIIITYFTGCTFYFLANLEFNKEDSPNFIAQLDLFKRENPEWTEANDVEFYDFIGVIYFSITCLSTVGYGDIVAKTNMEKLVALFFMLFGVGFFSFIMGSFIEIL